MASDEITDLGAFNTITDNGVFYAAETIPTLDVIVGGESLTLNSGVNLTLNNTDDWTLN